MFPTPDFPRSFDEIRAVSVVEESFPCKASHEGSLLFQLVILRISCSILKSKLCYKPFGLTNDNFLLINDSLCTWLSKFGPLGRSYRLLVKRVLRHERRGLDRDINIRRNGRNCYRPKQQKLSILSGSCSCHLCDKGSTGRRKGTSLGGLAPGWSA